MSYFKPIIRLIALPEIVETIAAVVVIYSKNIMYDLGAVRNRNTIEPARDIIKPRITKFRHVFNCVRSLA